MSYQLYLCVKFGIHLQQKFKYFMKVNKVIYSVWEAAPTNSTGSMLIQASIHVTCFFDVLLHELSTHPLCGFGFFLVYA